MPTLRDLGVKTTAMSNATGPAQSGPDLATLLQGLSSVPAQEATQLQGALSQFGGQETPNMLERLLSSKGLAIALGTLLAGKEAGGLGAAAFGLGGLQGLQAQEAADEQTKADAMERLQEQRDKALDRVEKSQQRATTLFQTNPEAFLDPETGEPVMSPEEIGLFTTGFPIRLFPQTRRKLDEATAAKEARHNLYVDALKNTTSLADARLLFTHMLKNQGWTDVPEGVADALAKAAGTDEWTATLANIIAQNATNAPDVFLHAAENGLPLEDAQVWRLVDWAGPSMALTTETQQKALLIQQFNQWLQANSDKAAEIRQQSPTDTEFLRSAMDEAFAEEPGNAQQLKVWLKVNEDEGMQFMKSYEQFSENHELAARLSGYDQLESIKEMSDEERAQYLARGALAIMRGRQQELLKAQAEQDAAWRNNIKKNIQSEFSLGPKSTSAITDAIFERAKNAAVRPDGRIDRTKFEEAVQVELQKVRQDLQ